MSKKTTTLIIKLETLRKVNGLILDYLEKTGINQVEIEKDYYWEILPEERYKGEKPKNLVMGQLFDDYESLKKILTGENQPLGYGLYWLSSLYKYIGEKHTP